MMISPVSAARVSFRGVDAMDTIEKTQKAMQTFSDIKEGHDKFTKNMKTDTEAYSDAVTSNLTKAAEENKALQPIADAANSKVGKKIADIFGSFTAFCTNLAGTATTVSTMSK